MTREEAIGHIKDVIYENNTRRPNIVVFEQEKEALHIAIEALKQEPRWIPVSEGLPEKDVWVLVTVVQASMEWVEIMKIDKYKGMFTDNIDYYDSVIAWMPLPKPYSGEQE